jgi:integrase
MLTELVIKNARPKARRFQLHDLPGLFLEIFPWGAKLWRLRVKIGGRNFCCSLGAWPDVGVKTARELAVELRRSLRTAHAGAGGPGRPAGVAWQEPGHAGSGHAGTDFPGQGPPPPPLTLKALCEAWKLEFFNGIFTQKHMNTIFNVHIMPALGHVPVDELTAGMVLEKLLRPIQDRGTRNTATRVRSLLGRVLRFGVATGQVSRDFTVDFRGALAAPITKHHPTILDPTKIGRLMQDLANYTGWPAVFFAINILPYVFVRSGELRHAEWQEFKDGMWRIPAEKMKMRTAHIVPLATQVTKLLEELRKHTGEGRWLFPGERSKDSPICESAINRALRSLGYGKDEICAHGFRAMASTLLNEQGYRPDWIERQLAHSERNSIRAAYNHAEFLPERRQMMQACADYLDKLRSSKNTPSRRS